VGRAGVDVASAFGERAEPSRGKGGEGEGKAGESVLGEHGIEIYVRREVQAAPPGPNLHWCPPLRRHPAEVAPLGGRFWYGPGFSYGVNPRRRALLISSRIA